MDDVWDMAARIIESMKASRATPDEREKRRLYMLQREIGDRLASIAQPRGIRLPYRGRRATNAENAARHGMFGVIKEHFDQRRASPPRRRAA
jgi:hypothetical protein